MELETAEQGIAVFLSIMIINIDDPVGSKFKS